MPRNKGAMRWAANFAAISAGFHALALPVSGFSTEALWLLPAGLIYAGFAYGLLNGWRWLGYIAFLVLLIGISLAVSNIWAFGDVPWWIYSAITVANLLSVLALFTALWKAPSTAT